MKQPGSDFREWFFPAAFILCAGWMIWHIPAYLLDWVPPASQSLLDQMTELHERKDITSEWPGPFGGYTDYLDWAALLLAPVFFIGGAMTVRCAPMEFEHWRSIDRIALFFGRVAMILVLTMTFVMLCEVFLRYAVEKPTLWANELTLWIAGFLFLIAGLYAMQQRCHIRIVLLYDVVPRTLQRIFDIIAVTMFAVFAFFLVFGSFHQVFIVKFYRWEMFGTAFDPPIPATVQPMILIMITLIAAQNIINLISDWNLEPKKHTAPGVDIDQDEIEAIKRAAGPD